MVTIVIGNTIEKYVGMESILRRNEMHEMRQLLKKDFLESQGLTFLLQAHLTCFTMLPVVGSLAKVTYDPLCTAH